MPPIPMLFVLPPTPPHKGGKHTHSNNNNNHLIPISGWIEG